jgi:hypothetical protein
MISDIEKTFWQDRGITPDAASVVSIFPSNAKDTLTAGGKMVIVATFARLNQLRREHPDIYDKLSATISLVLVDEGHYEPAVEWGKSVKGLNRRTILLTATPYRNDLKLFRITDPQRSTNHFTHADAVKSGIIRKLRCEELDSTTDIESLSQAFAKAWKEAKRNNSLASANPRAIICCSEDEDILTAVMHLQKAGLSVIGIHEQFEEEDDESLVKAVPDPKKEKAEIWVHQNKLTEGLDDHRFSCEVAKILRSNVKSSPLFQRYMPVCEPPETPVPKTISLDMLRSDVDLALTDGKECYLARSSSEVNETAKKNRTLYTCTFGIEANEIQKSSISLRLDFQRKKRRYWFNKQSGAAIQVTVAGENRTTTKSLAEFLNGKQDIVLIGLE